MYAYAFLDDFVLLYPVYALLFADTGLSTAEISSLFVVWALTSILVEVPSGVWADAYSRRRLLALAPLVTAAGYAAWTFFPSYGSFALGFVLWGAGGAIRSGTLQALVYEELAALGRAGSYARLTGRAEAVGMIAVMAATGLATPVMAAGGYLAVGVASVAALLLGALVARRFPESRAAPGPGSSPSADEPGAVPAAEPGADSAVEPSGLPSDGSVARSGHEEGLRAVLRAGLAEVRHTPAVRSAMVLVVVLMGVYSLDEYLPLLAGATGAGDAAVPLLVLLVTAATALGGWFAGRGTRWAAPALAVAAVALAAGALSGRPAGMVLVAAAYGVFQWSMTAAETRLQGHLTDRSRATVTSIAGLGADLVTTPVYALYGLGSTWLGPGPLFALAAVVYVLIALGLWLGGRRPAKE
ncbi:MFS transporter [Sphaerisporangium rhizosphaerae]|uniref:MFS transporter n=1 Tax=Sphaerisporangium rhizosphaerae TaxID=2269375 RepID=A0ABW2P889_9ACTN